MRLTEVTRQIAEGGKYWTSGPYFFNGQDCTRTPLSNEEPGPKTSRVAGLRRRFGKLNRNTGRCETRGGKKGVRTGRVEVNCRGRWGRQVRGLTGKNEKTGPQEWRKGSESLRSRKAESVTYNNEKKAKLLFVRAYIRGPLGRVIAEKTIKEGES